MTELQYLITVPSSWVLNRQKYISGPTDLHLLYASMPITVINIIILVNIIDCQHSTTITIRTRLDTLHVQYWMFRGMVCFFPWLPVCQDDNNYVAIFFSHVSAKFYENNVSQTTKNNYLILTSVKSESKMLWEVLNLLF